MYYSTVDMCVCADKIGVGFFIDPYFISRFKSAPILPTTYQPVVMIEVCYAG